MNQVMNTFPCIREEHPPTSIFVTYKGPDYPHGNHDDKYVSEDKVYKTDISHGSFVGDKTEAS